MWLHLKSFCSCFTTKLKQLPFKVDFPLSVATYEIRYFKTMLSFTSPEPLASPYKYFQGDEWRDEQTGNLTIYSFFIDI